MIGGRPPELTLTELAKFFFRILGPEKDFYWLAAIYGAAISLLSLALPISVQMLINTVANTGLITPLAVLSLSLFALLLISGLLNALRIHLMELFGRRFFARMLSQTALRTIYAGDPFFADGRRNPLFNRYFDMVIVQKTMPYLLIGGYTIVLQAIVGFVVVSLYHPFFLAFNLIFGLIIWITFAAFSPGAIRSGIALSHKKHEGAAWLEGLAASNGFFQSDRHLDYALCKTDEATGAYVKEHRRFFRRSFTQTVILLIVYAAASAILLGLGGWLVIQGQLTLGQLVAAELILSAVFAGVAQLGSYLVYFYDLCAAIEELSYFFDITQEEPRADSGAPWADGGLAFENVEGDARGRRARLNFSIPSGATVMACAGDHGLQRLVSSILKRRIAPERGLVSFGGADILSTDVYALRQEIKVIDRPAIVDMTVREYLSLVAQDDDPKRKLHVLKVIGLDETLANLPEGLDTRLAESGWPLSITETMQLKLAGAILARPRLLILNQLMDLIPQDAMAGAIAELHDTDDTTVIYFSNRRHDLGFDLFLRLRHEEQTVTDNFDAFLESNAVDPKAAKIAVLNA